MPVWRWQGILQWQLQDAGIDCFYLELSGVHEWRYWILRIREKLRFFHQVGTSNKLF